MADLESQQHGPTSTTASPSYAAAAPSTKQEPYREHDGELSKNHPSHAHTTATAESGSDLSQRNSREKDSALAQAALAHEVAEDEHEVSTTRREGEKRVFSVGRGGDPGLVLVLLSARTPRSDEDEGVYHEGPILLGAQVYRLAWPPSDQG